MIRLDNDDLFEVLKKYAVAVGAYLGALSEDERKALETYELSKVKREEDETANRRYER